MEEENFFYYLKFNGFRLEQEGGHIFADYGLERGDSKELPLTAAIDPVNHLAQFTVSSRKLLQEQCPAHFQKMLENSFADPDNPVFVHALHWRDQRD
ncbi:hypothetical protein [Sporolactobacillus vineae]|uniref:hypothetical protein n=1 Tax=Sporolactobacillus vineae TaxID=444463 RepID=UPI000288AAB9|nr:hypothetical protein [Sporolactobacillus vineae]